MSDRLLKLANSPLTGKIVKMLGLPTPVYLKREKGEYGKNPLENKNIILSQTSNSIALNSLNDVLRDLGANIIDINQPQEGKKYDVAILDATGCDTPDSLKQVYDFFHSVSKKLKNNCRILVLASNYKNKENPIALASARGIEGFVRAYSKELGRKGSTANLIYLDSNSLDRLSAPVRFFCTGRTAYVSGQPLELSNLLPHQNTQSTPLLLGKVALVTGAARGLGAATAKRLAAEGAKVICLDVSFSSDALQQIVKEVDGEAFIADISSENTPKELADFIQNKFGGVDIVVHNAGITRDKTLGNMSPQLWDQVIGVNFKAIVEIDKEFDDRNLINEGGRIICLSSVSGIAGNAGQCNYSTTKAALIDYAKGMSPQLAKKGISINAVAPGFIETEMTKKIPTMIREAGRRLNALSQGGQPEDVAELITFLACPDASGITGQTVRVCGQALIGA